MRKLYAFLTGIFFVLVSHPSIAQTTITQDVANFTFTVDTDNNNVAFINISVIGTEPGTRKAFWSFGDGSDQWTASLDNTQHHYAVAGTYTVCLKIIRYRSNTNDSVVSAYTCEEVTIPVRCRAAFERILISSNTPLTIGLRALPWNNANKKPARICWTFGDGRDTCITYPEDYTGSYTVAHHYNNAGTYQVCISIFYYGGCESKQCGGIIIELPDTCSADFERIPVSATNSPLNVYFKALPWHSNNKKPTRVCWTFGDGRDTCITYPESFTGVYAVSHRYNNAGNYEVCVKIIYYGECEAYKCKNIVIEKPDECRADFEQLPITTTNSLLNVYYKALPWYNNNKKPKTICWRFGDGRDTCINYPENYTGQYAVAHHYNQPGNYEVCVKIIYYGGCEAYKCKNIIIEKPDECRADFEQLPITTTNSLLNVYYKALPWHNNNKKPKTICWTFGDGHDTCINYPENYTGSYIVRHHYLHPGLYEPCVKILYYGGCDARKCKLIQIGRRDECRAEFERIPVIDVNDPFKTTFKALPWHNNERKPKTICWTFGDGRDTCVNYSENYTGRYIIRHRYYHAGVYEVCVKILYYGGCEAKKCKEIRVGNPASCTADFERLPVSTTNYPLNIYFKALPWNSQNRKPAKICWTFGDSRDTCINYPENYTGLYAIGHHYEHPGLYEVCVKILYYGGCEAKKCKDIQIGPLATCTADFERAPLQDNNPLTVALKALPQNSQNRKPARICWTFGDSRDTCINYPENYTGLYLVSHRYDHAGQYEVCVKILYYGGCEAKKCKEISIQPPVEICHVSLFEITPSITSLVRGFYASVSSTPERRVETICWYFGDGDDTCIMIEPTAPIPTPQLTIRHTYPGPGVYRACVKVRFVGGCEAYDCREVVIRPASDVCGGFMVDSLAGPRTYKFIGHSINRPNDEVIGYRWSFGDGVTATGQQVTHTYATAGDFEACLYIKTRLSCETRICKLVRVPGNNEPQLYLTPNPVFDIVNVHFRSTHTETVNIRIVNSNGSPVRSYTRGVTVGPNTWTHDLSSLMTGVYSYNIQSPNQQASVIFLKN